MNGQTETGKARTLLIEDKLQEIGAELVRSEVAPEKDVKVYGVGKYSIRLEIYPNGYNLYTTPSGENSLEKDLEYLDSLKS